MKNKLMRLQTEGMMFLAGVKPTKVKNVKKEPGATHLIEILGTVIIAVIILYIFKDALTELFQNIVDKTKEQIMALFGGLGSSGGGGGQG